MVKEIVVSEPILEDIARDGIKEAAKGREAFGTLVGYYDNSEDAIIVQQRYIEPSKIGTNTFWANIYDVLYTALTMPKFLRAFRLEQKHHTRTRNDSRIPAKVSYHTHPDGSWSPNDIVSVQDYQEDLLKISKDEKLASLLYMVRQNAFQAIDGYGNDIPVSKSRT